MLNGLSQHNMDPKGRVTFPSRFRDNLGDMFYVGRGLDSCLFVYSQKEIDELKERISKLPMKKGKDVSRFFFGFTETVSPDKQGRILIPQHLRTYAGIEKEVTIVGTGSRVEIWDSAKWLEYNSEQSQDKLMDDMDELDF